jgi:NAD(P)-dependent dehydrogenase (short-subunit alcohol dehydrogenase family)
MAELSGLAAVVTGGGSGIGLAARLLAERGAKVAVLDLKPGEEYTGLSTDVTDDASVGLAIDKAAESLGGIDILVNNVGIVRVTRAALPHLRASRHAAIVNTCSIAATAGLPPMALR